jgi:hypothetical protein
MRIGSHVHEWIKNWAKLPDRVQLDYTALPKTLNVV